jgi:dihydroneopterin aldolase
MTLFLASVRDAAEAEAAFEAGADIIDLKEPDAGALGAVDVATSAAVLSLLRGRVPVSATIGDLPMQPASIGEAVRDRAALGVDYVKVGIFPEGDPLGCLLQLRTVTRQISLIAVLFADRMPDFDAIEAVAAAGAAGIMLDTAEKGGGSLLDHLSLGDVSSFVACVKAHGLAVGLAGSLRASQISSLLALDPDVLGFRGALCQGSRNARLDRASCFRIRTLIPAADAKLIRQPSAAAQGKAAEALC